MKNGLSIEKMNKKGISDEDFLKFIIAILILALLYLIFRAFGLFEMG